jgi:hypothetical protein
MPRPLPNSVGIDDPCWRAGGRTSLQNGRRYVAIASTALCGATFIAAIGKKFRPNEAVSID